MTDISPPAGSDTEYATGAIAFAVCKAVEAGMFDPYLINLQTTIQARMRDPDWLHAAVVRSQPHPCRDCGALFADHPVPGCTSWS